MEGLTKYEGGSSIDDEYILHINDEFPNGFLLQRIFEGIFRQIFSTYDAGDLLALIRHVFLLLLLLN